MKLDFRSRLLATSLLVGAGMAASPAFAQDPAPPADPNAQPETTTAPVEATPPPTTSATGETVRGAGDIVITGTRIPQPNLTSASPVTILSSQDIKLQGTTRTEDIINSLPQSFASQGSNISNGSSGTASVNLRGLGSTRTLVLINGRRLQPGDPRLGSIADINFIPSSIVKRVDVLTGGASSVYGADAVAGVVNFIMDNNFRGLRLDAQASTFMHDNRAGSAIIDANETRNFRPPHGQSINGGAQDVSVAFGAGFDDNRGSIMAYATYRKQDAVVQASRDYSFCALAAAGGGGFTCGGSSTSAPGRFLTNVGNFHVEGNQFVPGTVLFNFAPYNFYQRPDERYTFGTFAEYEISPGAKPYLEAMFMHDVSNSLIAPSGDFFGTTSTINCDNPLLSAQQFNTICVPNNTFVDGQGVTQAIAYLGRRNVEGGGRQDNLEHTAYRIVAGVRGDLLRGLSYDAYYQFGTTRLSQVYKNDFSIARIFRALDAVANPAVGGVPGVPAGTPVCRSAIPGAANFDAACVPWNVFQTGGVTPAALAYLQVPLVQTGHVSENVANANFTLEGGEYGLQTPWSDRGVGLNVGAEYRKESLITEPDASFQSGDGAGQGAPTLPVQCNHGVPVPQGGPCGFDVREAFAEIQIPIISHSFIEELTLTGGYRYSDYKVAGKHFNTDTYKVAVELAPIHDVRARASYNRAVRAPNAVELFTQPFVGLGGTLDPCDGPAVGGLTNGTTLGPGPGDPGFTAAQCAFTGVSAAQFGNVVHNDANQYNAQFGGNVNLSPEKADTYTVGLVVQPRWIPGLALTVDYFDIKIRNLISTLGFQTIMANCLATGDPFFCSKIHRAVGGVGGLGGSLWLSQAGFIETTNTNIGGLRTKGFDLNGTYSRRLGGMGTISASYVATILRRLEIDTGVIPLTGPGDGKFNCAGFYGNTCGSFLTGAPNPKYRHKLRLGFTMPNGLGISGQWRYFSSVKNDQLQNDCDVTGATAEPCNGSAAPRNAKIKAQSYFDLALTARLADRYNFRIGANNLLDKSPPIVGGEVSNAPFGNGNTFPQVYDALGRFLFAGVTIDF